MQQLYKFVKKSSDKNKIFYKQKAKLAFSGYFFARKNSDVKSAKIGGDLKTVIIAGIPGKCEHKMTQKKEFVKKKNSNEKDYNQNGEHSKNVQDKPAVFLYIIFVMNSSPDHFQHVR